MIEMHKLVSFVMVLSFVSSSCKKIPATCALVKSANNKVNCKVDYSKLTQDRLAGIKINDNGIPVKEKIRHLNELNSMPVEFLNVMRGRITVDLTHGAITNLPQYAELKGVKPRGWVGDATWDDVPGIGGTNGLALGESIMNNNAWSLAIHEATHSVDSQSKFRSSKEFLAAFNADKGRPHPADTNGVYRTSYPEEYLAIAVDEYYCNEQTKKNLKTQYPLAYDLIEDHFVSILKKSGVQTPPPAGSANKPDQPIASSGSDASTSKPTPTAANDSNPANTGSADNIPQVREPYTIGRRSTQSDTCE